MCNVLDTNTTHRHTTHTHGHEGLFVVDADAVEGLDKLQKPWTWGQVLRLAEGDTRRQSSGVKDAKYAVLRKNTPGKNNHSLEWAFAQLQLHLARHLFAA